MPNEDALQLVQFGEVSRVTELENILSDLVSLYDDNFIWAVGEETDLEDAIERARHILAQDYDTEWEAADLA